MSNQDIFDYLKECGCCDICCLRYLKSRGNEYKDINKTLDALNVKRSTDEINKQKRIRSNNCATCLGLFDKDFTNKIIDEIVNNSNVNDFDCKDIVIAISLPILLQIRQLSMWFALINKFGGLIDADKAPEVPIKEAAKLIMNTTICEKLNKNYDANGIMINIHLNHNDEITDIKKLIKIDECIFPKNPRAKKQNITRGYMERNYIASKIPSDIFQKYVQVPPDIPSTGLFVQNISLNGPTVFLAGRYRKLTRELSHSPWVLQGKRVMEDSIQEIIIRNVSSYFGVSDETIVFVSSGREDVDVRCLGKGRPFVLEIPNSNRISLSKELAGKIEIEIEKSLKVSVNNLQMVQREDLAHIKTGEEMKKKSYRALCILNDPPTLEMLQKLDMPNGFQIEQVTPIRVLHRRPLHTRPRNVYSVKGYIDPNNKNFVILDIVSQAGTYIKELVHGDFGRTTPSISSIIGTWIDIIALDVTKIDLDWPKEVDNRIVTEEK